MNISPTYTAAIWTQKLASMINVPEGMTITYSPRFDQDGEYTDPVGFDIYWPDCNVLVYIPEDQSEGIGAFTSIRGGSGMITEDNVLEVVNTVRRLLQRST